MIDCAYVFISLMYAIIGLTYGYVLWQLLEVVDTHARGMDT